MHVAQLKQKIKSVTMTRKVTDALRLISMSLYGTLERHKKALQAYNQATTQLLNKIAHEIPTLQNNVFLPTDKQDQRPLFIIIGPTKGFCGSLQEHFTHYLEQKLHIQPHQNPSFLMTGNTTIDFIKSRYNAHSSVQQLELNMHTYSATAQALATKIITAQTPFSSVTCYGHRFKSFFLYKPQRIPIIPLTIATTHAKNEPMQDYIWEQTPHIILERLMASYLRTLLTDILFESLLCEYAARFLAMDIATTNADNVLEKMQLHYNKMRQALITKELAELSAGTTQQMDDA